MSMQTEIQRHAQELSLLQALIETLYAQGRYEAAYCAEADARGLMQATGGLHVYLDGHSRGFDSQARYEGKQGLLGGTLALPLSEEPRRGNAFRAHRHPEKKLDKLG
ncbi:hypothetical protein SAMN05421823_102549 [Catalinimonas alkaloidigena]|uniref:Uncharacterized protein n=1 Tax=Catalinimonas alkaloidigena TaxID=1075417 RepID=A0A1G9B8I7_9BACT|nr:hypothetical protein [Catalinimonas alkaloidigena]SDK35886.1 hypothetical protein SAMN05421823_102549 [Catalinimonas alkaloidigena]